MLGRIDLTIQPKDFNMDKEPNELVEARASLKRWEENFRAPESLLHLERGISLLSDVTTGDFARIYKDRVNMMAVAYRNKILLEIKRILSNADSYDLDYLEHWHNAMAVFNDAGFADDQEFSSCKEQLFSTWGVRLLRSLSPWEIEEIKRSHQQRTTTEGKKAESR